MTTLHGYFRSSTSFRVRICLALKGIAYESLTYHLPRGEHQRADYRLINPQGLVPALEIDGLRLTQSLAIAEYLDETHPEPPLLPTDAAGRARVRQLAQVVGCDIHPVDNLRILGYLRRELGQDEAAVARWFNHWVVQGFDALEAMLAGSPHTGRYCHGERPTLADVCLVPQYVNSARFGLDLSAYPTIARIVAACLELPAFERSLPRHQPDAEQAA
jgi:maleylpyruvate isomerase